MKKEFKYIKNVPIELLLPHEQIQSHIVNYWDDMYINKSFIPAVAVSDQKMIIDGIEAFGEKSDDDRYFETYRYSSLLKSIIVSIFVIIFLK